MKKTVYRLAFLIITVAFQLAASAPARASSTTYDYTGNILYEEATGGVIIGPTSLYVTGQVTIDFSTSNYTGWVYTPDISAELTVAGGAPPPFTWQPINEQDLHFTSGVIDEWDLSGGVPPNSQGQNSGDYIETFNSTVMSTFDLYRYTTGAIFDVNSYSPGTWTGPTGVPEPCTILLIGSGLAGLAALRKKFSNS